MAVRREGDAALPGPRHTLSVLILAALTLAVPGGPCAAGSTAPPAAGSADRSPLPGPIAAEVLKVIDGDTLRVRARIWIGQDVQTNVRLNGIDTPELRARCPAEREKARAARDTLRRLVGEAPVTLSEVEPDKYGGRVRARVRTAAGADLAQTLIRAGLARPYHGERRGDWCGT